LTQNGNTVASGALDSNGSATFTYTPSAPESDVFVAGYLGVSGQFNPSTSQPVTEVVNDPTQNTVTTVTCSPNPGAAGQPVTVTVQVNTAS
jgi:hypothetical protein